VVRYFLQVRALRTIAAICTMLLSQWSSVPQEDQQALSLGMDSAGLPLSSDMKLAMQFRLEKKRLLLHAVNEISKQIQVSKLRCQPWCLTTFRSRCCMSTLHFNVSSNVSVEFAGYVVTTALACPGSTEK
jgi:hypothetical protein